MAGQALGTEVSTKSPEQTELFETVPSTWELILQHCPEKEVEEVKRILGAALIDQSVDLHDEVSCSQEFWAVASSTHIMNYH